MKKIVLEEIIWLCDVIWDYKSAFYFFTIQVSKYIELNCKRYTNVVGMLHCGILL